MTDNPSQDSAPAILSPDTRVSEWGTALSTRVSYDRVRVGMKPHKVSRTISKRLDSALHFYVIDGLDLAVAAEKAGITRQSLSQSIVRPHIQERCRQIRTDSMNRAGIKAVHRIKDLSAQDDNKTVALDASRWLAATAGIGPPDRRSPTATGGRMVVMVLNKKNGTAVKVSTDHAGEVELDMPDATDVADGGWDEGEE